MAVLAMTAKELDAFAAWLEKMAQEAESAHEPEDSKTLYGYLGGKEYAFRLALVELMRRRG